MRTALDYLATLRRIPDEIILSMATRPINLPDFEDCVCGWAARETYARQMNLDAADSTQHDGTWLLAQQYGGDVNGEWRDVNHAYMYDEAAEELELAFVERVLECVP